MSVDVPVCIIGTGVAGYTLARELRRQKWQGPLLILTADDGRSYSKPLLSTALAQQKDVDGLTMATADRMAVDLQAEIRTHSQVTAIDPEQHTVTVLGQTVGYTQLVLALGSAPVRLPLTGSGAADVLSVNTLADYGVFRHRMQQARRVAIIGPGLIGCEFANDVLQSGREVSIIGPDAWPVSALLPEPAGRALQYAMAERGAVWHLGTLNGPIERDGDGYQTVLNNGVTVTADLVLSAVGVRPVTALAEQAGLQVARGIVTDRYLQTSAPDVFALGDCAAVDGRNLPYIAPIMAGARALAATLAGQPTPVVYPVMPLAIKTTLHPVVAVPPQVPGGWWSFEDVPDYTGVVGRYHEPSGALRGFVLTGSAVAQKSVLLRELESSA
jgi:rubredoxin-NAD+ reductase